MESYKCLAPPIEPLDQVENWINVWDLDFNEEKKRSSEQERSISIGVKRCTEENPYDKFPRLGGRSHPQLGLSCQRWLSRPSLALQHLPGAQIAQGTRESLSNSTCQAPIHHLYVDNHDTCYLYKSIYTYLLLTLSHLFQEAPCHSSPDTLLVPLQDAIDITTSYSVSLTSIKQEHTGVHCSVIPNSTAHKRRWNNLLWRCTAVDSTASPHSTTTQICPPQFPSLCQKSPITYRFWLPRQILVNFWSCDSTTKILKASDEAVTLTIPESEAVHLSSEYRLAVLARTWTPHLTSFLE